ncbi:hypothetical protein SAMN05216266_12726 [Amycolatopsis marina]|uniref:Uncharacterized protein n=1 Tax=Amycolatopsis marina TaxID=490629 RepID=A0A1I1CEP8_9PSEU|nr:hypothetical protein SAMN05216266_12726 [Amycolatopsis marina]
MHGGLSSVSRRAWAGGPEFPEPEAGRLRPGYGKLWSASSKERVA